MKFIIVGAGLSGTVAARLLKDKGHEVKIFETRNHIAGNCYDSNICGTTVHNYGPHIFHTDDEDVFSFLSRFTEWIPFELKPQGNTVLGNIPLPYHDKGCKKAIGKIFDQNEIIEYIFKDYSEKQWGVPFNEIPKTITNRIPKTKDAESPTWFEGQKYQCIPKDGYTKMFECMLDGIEVKLNCDPDEWMYENNSDYTIYTGKIDEFYDYCFGKLPYRTLFFQHEVTSKKQNTCTINQCNSLHQHTRQYDHSYFTPDHKGITVITKEFSKAATSEDIPFYPIPWGEGQEIYNKYEELAKKETTTIFLGRLATYKYLDMWMCVRHVMNKLEKL